jgi:cytochrome c-type biogenesis protein CcmH
MLVFWILVVLLTVGATASVVVPLFRSSSLPVNAARERQRRLDIYRDRRHEIDADRDAGRLEAGEAAQAIDALAREAASLEATLPAGDAGQPAPRWRRLLAAVVFAVLIPAGSIALYGTIGAPGILGIDPSVNPHAGSKGPSLDKMIADLEARTARTPDDGEAWATLAQARRMKGDLPGALAAFDKAGAVLGPNARLLAEQAETLAASHDGDFAGQPMALLEKALATDPKDQKALAMMGAAQFRAGNRPEALRHLRALLAELTPGSPEASEIQGVIDRIAGNAARTPPAEAPRVAGATSAPAGGNAPRAAPPAASSGAAKADPASTLSGTVRLSRALAKDVAPSTSLFVIARAAEGPRIPYAVLRAKAGDLPYAFSLSDAQAMDPARPLSAAGAIVVEARLSLSGDAMRKPGDLFGVSAVLRPGAREVAIEIDQVVQ